MNEQEMILRKKIEKREKVDTLLAYVLIVILVGCIGVVLYLKFIREEEPVLEEYIPNYITLSEISTSLNSSVLANRYSNDNASFNSSISGNELVVTYIKDDTNVNLNIPVIGTELEVTIPEENINITKEIYKEIANIICVYYGNSESSCRNVLGSSGSIDGIRIVNNKVYITTTKSIDVNSEIVYDTVTPTSITNTNYILNMLDTKINNININTSDTNITFTGNLEKIVSDNSNISVVVKLYDTEGTVLGENKYEYETSKEIGAFEISFILSEELKIDSIDQYSIEVIK